MSYSAAASSAVLVSDTKPATPCIRVNLSSLTTAIAPIIRPIMRWNLHSNACDVLGLGPRTAGILATVGVQTVASLLAVSPVSIARRLNATSITADLLVSWQYEARLVLDLPDLSAEAARLLGAVGIHSAQQIRHSTPTELLAELEAAQHQSDGWLSTAELPTVAIVSQWILLAQSQEKSHAA